MLLRLVAGGVGREEDAAPREFGGRNATVGLGGGGGRDRSSMMLEMRDTAVSATRDMAVRDAAILEDQFRPLLLDFVASLKEVVCVSAEGGQGEQIPS